MSPSSMASPARPPTSTLAVTSLAIASAVNAFLASSSRSCCLRFSIAAACSYRCFSMFSLYFFWAAVSSTAFFSYISSSSSSAPSPSATLSSSFVSPAFYSVSDSSPLASTYSIFLNASKIIRKRS